MKAHDFVKTETGQYIEAEVLKIFRKLDLNQDGEVTLEEFLHGFPNKTDEDFKRMDTNSDGKHTLSEQTAHQSKGLEELIVQIEKNAANIVDKSDTDGDGHVSMKEYDRIVFHEGL